MGRTVAAFFKPAPVVYHMLGPMDARPKERRQVVRQKRKAVVGEWPSVLGVLAGGCMGPL